MCGALNEESACAKTALLSVFVLWRLLKNFAVF